MCTKPGLAARTVGQGVCKPICQQNSGRAWTWTDRGMARALAALLVMGAVLPGAVGQVAAPPRPMPPVAKPALPNEWWYVEICFLIVIAFQLFVRYCPHGRLRHFMRGEPLPEHLEKMGEAGDFPQLIAVARALGPDAYYLFKFGPAVRRAHLEDPLKLLAVLRRAREPVVERVWVEDVFVDRRREPDNARELDRAIAAVERIRTSNQPGKRKFVDGPKVKEDLLATLDWVGLTALVCAVALPTYVVLGLTAFNLSDVLIQTICVFAGLCVSIAALRYMRWSSRGRYRSVSTTFLSRPAFLALLALSVGAGIQFSVLPRALLRSAHALFGQSSYDQFVSSSIVPILDAVAQGEAIPVEQEHLALVDARDLGDVSIAAGITQFFHVYNKNKGAYAPETNQPALQKLFRGSNYKVDLGKEGPYQELWRSLRTVDLALRRQGYALLAGIQENQNILAIVGHVVHIEQIKNVDGSPINVITFDPISTRGLGSEETLEGLNSKDDVFLLIPQIHQAFAQFVQRTSTPETVEDQLCQRQVGVSPDSLTEAVRIHEIRHAMDRSTDVENTETSARLAEVALGATPFVSLAELAESASQLSSDDPYGKQLRLALNGLQAALSTPVTSDYRALCSVALSLSELSLRRAAERAYEHMYNRAPGLGPLRSRAEKYSLNFESGLPDLQYDPAQPRPPGPSAPPHVEQPSFTDESPKQIERAMRMLKTLTAKNVRQAIKIGGELISAYPGRGAGWYIRGVGELELNRVDSGLDDLDKTFALSSNDGARKGIIQIYERLVKVPFYTRSQRSKVKRHMDKLRATFDAGK